MLGGFVLSFVQARICLLLLKELIIANNSNLCVFLFSVFFSSHPISYLLCICSLMKWISEITIIYNNNSNNKKIIINHNQTKQIKQFYSYFHCFSVYFRVLSWNAEKTRHRVNKSPQRSWSDKPKSDDKRMQTIEEEMWTGCGSF